MIDDEQRSTHGLLTGFRSGLYYMTRPFFTLCVYYWQAPYARTIMLLSRDHFETILCTVMIENNRLGRLLEGRSTVLLDGGMVSLLRHG